jgi:hypothetical protein
MKQCQSVLSLCTGTWIARRLLAVLLLSVAAAYAEPVELTVQAGKPGKPISPDLVGVFFEDLNYAADGGLYAELIQNRSF